MIYSLSTSARVPADAGSDMLPQVLATDESLLNNKLSQKEMDIATEYYFSVFKPQMDPDPLRSPCDLDYGDIHFIG